MQYEYLKNIKKNQTNNQNKNYHQSIQFDYRLQQERIPFDYILQGLKNIQ